MPFEAIGVSSIGNTSGTTGTVFGTVVLQGGNNITLSQITGASGSHTILVSGANPGAGEPALRLWQNAPAAGAMTGASYAAQSLYIFPLDEGNAIFPGDMTVKTVLFDVSQSVFASSSSHSMTFKFGLYTVSASSTLALIQSVQTTWALAANINNSLSYIGQRFLTIDGSLFSGGSLTLSNGLYYGAIIYRSSNINAFNIGSFLGVNLLTSQVVRSGTFAAASSSANSMGIQPFVGVYSASTLQFPASIVASEITRTASSANFVPHIIFNNLMSAF